VLTFFFFLLFFFLLSFSRKSDKRPGLGPLPGRQVHRRDGKELLEGGATESHLPSISFYSGKVD